MKTGSRSSEAALLLVIFLGIAFAHQPSQQHHQAQQQPPVPPQQAQMNQQPHPSHPDQPAANSQHQFGGQETQNAEHIKEHLDGKVDPTANMTREQLNFHYFNMYDLDKNNRIDGIEIIKAVTHTHVKDNSQTPPLIQENELEERIDSILKKEDLNNDGYIDYAEFLKAHK